VIGAAGDQFKGLSLAISGVLLLSPDALLVRMVSADHWTLLFWRCGIFAAVLLLALALLAPRRLGETLRSLWRGPMLAAGLAYCFTSLCFIYSITHTLAANTLFIVGAAPLFGALISHLVLGERLPRRTWTAILLCTAGLALIFAGTLGGTAGEAADGGALAGDLAALGTAAGLAVNANIVRHYRRYNMLPSLVVGSAITALIGAAMALQLGFDPLVVSDSDLLWLFAQGAGALALPFALLTLAPRYIPAPEVNLVMLLESFLGPLWVWWFLAEVPPSNTLLGGALVLGTILAYTASKLLFPARLAAPR